MKKDKPRLIAGKTRIKDNNTLSGSQRGEGAITEVLGDGRAKVTWSGTGRTTTIATTRINGSKHGYSIVE